MIPRQPPFCRCCCRRCLHQSHVHAVKNDQRRFMTAERVYRLAHSLSCFRSSRKSYARQALLPAERMACMKSNRRHRQLPATCLSCHLSASSSPAAMPNANFLLHMASFKAGLMSDRLALAGRLSGLLLSATAPVMTSEETVFFSSASFHMAGHGRQLSQSLSHSSSSLLLNFEFGASSGVMHALLACCIQLHGICCFLGGHLGALVPLARVQTTHCLKPAVFKWQDVQF